MDTSNVYLNTTLARRYTEDRMREASNRRRVLEARRPSSSPVPEPRRHSVLWSLVHLRRSYA